MCNIAGYVGQKTAAPILFDMLAREEKWDAFVNSINYMPEGNDYVKVSFLSTNGSITYGHPYKYANALNKKLLDSDIELNGWVIVDFCSPKLAERIYRYNFE